MEPTLNVVHCRDHFCTGRKGGSVRVRCWAFLRTGTHEGTWISGVVGEGLAATAGIWLMAG
jgi:hypothetical protein